MGEALYTIYNVLASTSLFANVSNFTVGCESFSAHFPLMCTIKWPLNDTQKVKHRDKKLNPAFYYKWKETMRSDFVNTFGDFFRVFEPVCRSKHYELQKRRRNDLISCRNDSKLFWSTLKSIKDNKHPNINCISDSEWFEYFKQLFCDPNNYDNWDNRSVFNDITRPVNGDILNEVITESEVRESIAHLRGNCSPGTDGICMEIFKSTSQLITPYMTGLFNNIFNTGNFPSGWRENVITPIHKKGPLKDTNNYLRTNN
ncbi:hypothetical protein MAR_002564 [Mya arenaria]|uniref:Reverse transcriptase n=1 Tax=Mya arenaria TaxID=6604 RepID=A0ABY7G7I0_MYAAR|nr:hypothetical protein MAR_002564 [Mya arenaria]